MSQRAPWVVADGEFGGLKGNFGREKESVL